MEGNKTASYKPGSIGDVLAMALPMMVSTACDAAMTFTDRLFLARVGSVQMNAALGGGVAYQMLVFFFIGLTGYATALVAQYYGAGAWENSSKASFQAILLTFFAWPVVWLVEPLVVGLFHRFDLSQDQVRFQIQYLNILVWGGLFGMMRQTVSCYFTGIGRVRVVMVAALTAMLVNVLLDYILIFGKLGIKPMGVQGAALATVTGSISAVSVLLVAYFSRYNRSKFSVMQSFRFDGKIMQKLIRFGSPAGLEMLLGFMAFFLMTMMFQSKGESEATAATIMFNWDMVSFIPLLGIEIAVTSLVGRYMGADRPDMAYRSAVSAIKTGLFYSLFILVLFLSIPETLVRVFHPHTPSSVFEAAVPMAKIMMRIAALYVLAQAMSLAMVGTLRGAGDTLYTMMLSVAANWAFLPSLYVTLYVCEGTVPLGWFVITLVYLVFCFFIYRRFRIGKWKTMRVISDDHH